MASPRRTLQDCMWQTATASQSVARCESSAQPIRRPCTRPAPCYLPACSCIFLLQEWPVSLEVINQHSYNKSLAVIRISWDSTLCRWAFADVSKALSASIFKFQVVRPGFRKKIRSALLDLEDEGIAVIRNVWKRAQGHTCPAPAGVSPQHHSANPKPHSVTALLSFPGRRKTLPSSRVRTAAHGFHLAFHSPKKVKSSPKAACSHLSVAKDASSPPRHTGIATLPAGYV